jgi:GWxTD domain-containing protein
VNARALPLLAIAAGCFRSAAPAATPEGPVGRVVTPEAINASDVYRRAGFVTAEGDIPFVGTVRYLAGPEPATTLVLVALSFPNRSLSFTRDADQYRATYDVSYDVHAGTTPVQHRASRSEVRVGSFRETTRGEESVIAQQILAIAPGTYTLEITTRDGGSVARGRAATTISVPRFGNGPLLSATPVYQVTPRDSRAATVRLIANPRGTVVYGRDSVLQIYLETYGPDAPRAVRIQANAGSATLYSDSVRLTGPGDVHSALARLPVSRIGLGVETVTLTPSGIGAPSVGLPIVVRLGDELAVASFEEMLQYLRFFVAPERLRALRDTAAEVREAAWAAFVSSTDSLPKTTDNEALRAYLRRVQSANAQFREDETPGWLTDRGKVFSLLGEADKITEPNPGDPTGRGMTLVWEYRGPQLQFVFVDQTGLGQWRMSAASQVEFDDALKRLTSCAACR